MSLAEAVRNIVLSILRLQAFTLLFQPPILTFRLDDILVVQY